MTKAIGAPEDHVARGDLGGMLAWLREHVHPIGRALNAEQLVEQVSGKPLSAESFLNYLELKLSRLSPALSGSC